MLIPSCLLLVPRLLSRYGNTIMHALPACLPTHPSPPPPHPIQEEAQSRSAATSGRDSPESILVDTLAPTANERGAAKAPQSTCASRMSTEAAAGKPGDISTGVERVSAGMFYGVEFRHEDATAEAKLVYTHIYIFDWVFSKDTLKKLAKVLQASPFYVLLSFRPPAEWWGNGLVKVSSSYGRCEGLMACCQGCNLCLHI